MAGNLNPRQQAFVEAYLRTGNASEAARQAGYSAHTADVQGPRLLRNARISKVVAERSKQAIEAAALTTDDILAEVASMARVPLHQLGEPVKAADKLRALELLGKHHKLWTDRVEASGDVTINLVNPYAQGPGHG